MESWKRLETFFCMCSIETMFFSDMTCVAYMIPQIPQCEKTSYGDVIYIWNHHKGLVVFLNELLGI